MNNTRENRIDIIGTLESNNLIKDTSPKVGAYIRGDMVIKVQHPKPMSIPISYFAGALTKDNKPRKLYSQLENLRVGQRIAISGQIQDNKFWDATRGSLVKTKRLGLVFINPVKESDEDKAEFVFSGFVAENLKEVVDRDGVVTGLSIKIAQADYQGTRALVIPFNVDPKNSAAIRHIEENYTVRKSVKVSGVLDYNIITETREEAVDFGAPIVRTFQRNISNLIITGGTAVSDGAYEVEDISILLEGDKTDDERVMAEAKNKERSGEQVSVNKPLASKATNNQSLL